jgi:thiosulfate reductase cytochrome b subunit
MAMQDIPKGKVLPTADSEPAPQGGDLVRRHRLSTRLWHWANALALLIMLMSGLMIFNAHPRLYWGEYGANPDAAWLEIGSMEGIAFPGWLTIPSTYSLADARIWHLAFAWILLIGVPLYLIWSLVNGHLRRDLWLTRAELKPSHIWHDIKQHAQLRFPTGAAALNYNVLQKTAYLGVLLVLLPLVILTGLAMSPGFDAAVPVSSWFGGRQSARSLHFIAAGGFGLFIVVHLVMVVLAGPLNEVRSMITGNYRLPRDKGVRP